MNGFRYENKYVLTTAGYRMLRTRLRALMEGDANVNEQGEYFIRSLYFDDAFQTGLTDKREGALLREKFRIRCYNEDLSFITLEKKLKHNDPYILVTNCTDENAENAVMDILGEEAAHCVVKSKTVTTSGIELTAELRMKTASTAFVNAIAQLPGVETATLVSYNGEYLS